MKLRYIIISLVIIFGCSPDKAIEFKAYDLKFEGMTFNGIPYKFSKAIEGKMLQENGNQFAAFEYSYIGDTEEVLKNWDLNASKPDALTADEIEEFEKFKPTKATSYIVEEAKSHQVTIINEAHHQAQHRVFTTKILQQLYDIGYRHVGMEALLSTSKSDSLLLSNNYPVIENGYYIKEPQFGNLVRQALKIGYKVFGYESYGHNGAKEREINQARNIEAYITEHPKGKVLIHCGFGHAKEGIGGKWEKAMASRLSDFMGINPLSINQTYYSEKSSKEIEDPYFQLVNVDEPTIYINDKGKVFGNYKKGSWFDISVFHPRTKNFNRPEWLIFDDRKEVTINLEDAQLDFPCLVYAYLKGEKMGYAVPYDVKETKDEKVTLVLEPENYNIVLLDQKDKSLQFEYEVRN